MAYHSKSTLIKIDTPQFDRSGQVTLSSHLILHRSRQHRFFFRLAEKDFHPQMVEQDAHHLFALLMPAMRIGRPLHVHGRLERRLAQQMETYMRYWSRWCPDRFREIPLSADEWIEAPLTSSAREGAISCFSGGVDSFYSMLRLQEDTGHRVKSLLFLHGLDISLSRKKFYQDRADEMEPWLHQRSLKLIRVQMNAKETARRFQLNWGMIGHGSFLAAALQLFSHDHALGCMPSSHSPDGPCLPWGSNPVTDPLYSISHFQQINHAFQVPRYEKISELSQHEDYLPMLRVCWQEQQSSVNCGFCPKCIVSLLALEVAKPGSWKCVFPHVSDLESIYLALNNKHLSTYQWNCLDAILQHAVESHRDDVAHRLAPLLNVHQHKSLPLMIQLRRWFYRWKCNMALRSSHTSPQPH